MENFKKIPEYTDKSLIGLKKFKNKLIKEIEQYRIEAIELKQQIDINDMSVYNICIYNNFDGQISTYNKCIEIIKNL